MPTPKVKKRKAARAKITSPTIVKPPESERSTRGTSVTARVDAASRAAASEEEAARLRNEETTRIDEGCEADSGLRCQVVSLYHGGIYSLYKYRRRTDVRLVFAPEHQAAAFGGDPDNFTYPRHDLDVTFLRAYEDGEPVQPEHYFKWSQSGAAEGEPVFVTGNPGTTLRLAWRI